MDAFAEFPRHLHVRQFRAMDDDEIDRISVAVIQPGFVRQRPIVDGEIHRHALSVACAFGSCQRRAIISL